VPETACGFKSRSSHQSFPAVISRDFEDDQSLNFPGNTSGTFSTMSTLEWILIIGLGAIILCLYGLGMAIDKVNEKLSEILDELEKLADRISPPPND
jgi:hypothetical protein